MKKQVLVLLVIVILVSTTIQAAVPYKEALEVNNYKINSVQCSDNKLRVLVESNAEVNLKILFKVYSSRGNINIFSNQSLKRLNADWFNLDTNLACSDLLRLEVNGYAPIEDNQNVVYMNTESSYEFTGNENPISQENINKTETIISPPTSPESIMPVYPSSSYVYLNGKLIQSINEDSEETYYAQDQIGSNTILTDSNGNLIAKNEYDPFGQDLSNNKGEFKYTGKPQDSSGLYYYGARYYNANTGRFISVDPEFKATESSYNYVNNDPLVKNDPTGKGEKITGATFGIEYFSYGNANANEIKKYDDYVTNNFGKLLNAYRDSLGVEREDTPAIKVWGNANTPPGTAGAYDEDSNSIYLMSMPILRSYFFNIDINKPVIDGMIVHELVHATNRAFKGPNYIKLNKNIDSQRLSAVRTLDEGIAMFYQDRYNGGYYSELYGDNWLNSVPGALDSVKKNHYSVISQVDDYTYALGLNIVSPILKKYGYNNGAGWIMTHLPSEEETHDMRKYQTRALNDLSK